MICGNRRQLLCKRHVRRRSWESALRDNLKASFGPHSKNPKQKSAQCRAACVKAGWLEQFEKEALEMPTQNMAIRGSKYLGHKWDAFKHLMPAHVVEHINGNAIYNLKPCYALAECCPLLKVQGGIGQSCLLS